MDPNAVPDPTEPKPDPSPGPEQPAKNFKDASPKDFAAELAKYGIRPRWDY